LHSDVYIISIKLKCETLNESISATICGLPSSSHVVLATAQFQSWATFCSRLKYSMGLRLRSPAQSACRVCCCYKCWARRLSLSKQGTPVSRCAPDLAQCSGVSFISRWVEHQHVTCHRLNAVNERGPCTWVVPSFLKICAQSHFV
jgi:hypothetical protein